MDMNLKEIHELNLSYLLLAQRLLREDLPTAMYRLGLDHDAATILKKFTLAQLIKLAQANVVVCKFRLDDYELLSSLNRDGLNGTVLASHATILLAQAAVDREQENATTLSPS